MSGHMTCEVNRRPPNPASPDCADSEASPLRLLPRSTLTPSLNMFRPTCTSHDIPITNSCRRTAIIPNKES